MIQKKEVLILLAEGVEIFEAAAFIDVLGWAGEYGNETVEFVTAALRNNISCTFGFGISPAAIVANLNLDRFDALAIPGGFETAGFYRDAYSREFLDVIRYFDSKERIIASICVGALPLAKSGILKGKKATTYHLGGGKRRKQLADMGADVIDGLIVEDGNIITSTSPVTAVWVALRLLARLTSRKNAEKIRDLMGFNLENAGL